MPDIVENFSAGLSYMLDSRHIVQSHMAQEIGISSSTLTDYKHGRLRGDETRRERIAAHLGMSERRVRQLGQMIRNGVPGEEALEMLRAQDTAPQPSRDDMEVSAFRLTLDSLFGQITEFLRDRYGETLRVATVFESRFVERFEEFAEWKQQISDEVWEHNGKHGGSDANN